MPKYKIIISYKGTAYCGWQVQPNGLAVQQVLEEKLSEILQHPTKTKGSGRTDAGVHALGQVAHFSTANPLAPEKILMGLRSLLPEDITIQSITLVPEDFNAQTSAKWKTYLYFVNNSERRNPFLIDFSWQQYGPLDARTMRQCLKLLEGEHDFKAFTASDTQVENYVRHLKEASLHIHSWAELHGKLWHLFFSSERESLKEEPNTLSLVKSLEENLFSFQFTGNGFLKHMIRNIVGTVVNVGQGKYSVEDFRVMLESGDRREAGMAAPAKGLLLFGVEY